MFRLIISLSVLVWAAWGTLPNASAAGACTACFGNVTDEEIAHHQAHVCTNHHCIDRECLAHQVQSEPNVLNLESSGLPCCGTATSGEKCNQRLPLSAIREVLETKERDALDERIAKAHHIPLDHKSQMETYRLSQGIEESFNLCCPTNGCGGTLGQLEGCNVASCSNESCKTTFCYLCLKPQKDDPAPNQHHPETSAHVKGHSENYWEWRPGYADRYQWLLARKELGSLFKKKVSTQVRAAALGPHKALLEEKKMWPMPAGLTSAEWVGEVLRTPESSRKFYEFHEVADSQGNKRQERTERTEALHTSSQKIELLQNEYIYLRQQEDMKNAEVVKAELQRQGGNVLASLDVRDAAGESAGARPAHGVPNVGNLPQGDAQIAQANAVARPVPVGANDPRVTPAFAALGPDSMYQVGGLIWSAMVGPHDVEVRNMLGILRVERRDGKMKQQVAEAFCRTLGPTAYLPTREEYEALARAMTVNGHYDRNRIPDMSGNWFWSASVHPADPDYAFYFHGSYGNFDFVYRSLKRSVRCVLPAV